MLWRLFNLPIIHSRHLPKTHSNACLESICIQSGLQVQAKYAIRLEDCLIETCKKNIAISLKQQANLSPFNSNSFSKRNLLQRGNGFPWDNECRFCIVEKVFRISTNLYVLIFLRNTLNSDFSCMKSVNVEFRETMRYCHRQQPLLYSIDIWPARNSRLTQRETNMAFFFCSMLT